VLCELHKKRILCKAVKEENEEEEDKADNEEEDEPTLPSTLPVCQKINFEVVSKSSREQETELLDTESEDNKLEEENKSEE